ncbi:MAG: hypothetical protein JSU85_10040 [Candidatus Zixiibacteriota bacterium]|nr:MAG: hypothetical protein JSU85_10040 [candidate division Zixibacteria bacterium]
MLKKFASPTILILLCLLFIYCDGDNGPTPSNNPVLSSLQLIDTVHYADSQIVSLLVSDPQGLNDIDSVFGNYMVPGNTGSVRYIQFRDDGTNGDANPGDGRFTSRFRPGSGFLLDDYTINIGASDLSGNFAAQIDSTFSVIDTTTPLNPVLSDVQLELYHYYRDSQTVSVMVSDPNGPGDIDSVLGRYYFDEITPVYTQIIFNDDGINGDLTPGDDRYTAMFLPDSGAFIQGIYKIDLWAVDLDGLESAWYDTFFVSADSAGLVSPALFDLELEIIHNYSDSQTVSIFVDDPQGYDNIDSVWGEWFFVDNPFPVEQLLFYDDGTHGDQASGDSRFTITFMADTGVFDIGLHYLSIFAADIDGHQSDQLDTTFTTVGNPTLFNVVAPDSIEQILGETVRATITVDAYDPDGLTDIDSVYSISILEGYPPNPPFRLYDDGDSLAHGDIIGGDGTYSRIIEVYDSNVPGDYLFTFYAIDSDENVSNNPQIIITVYSLPPPY